MEAESLEGVEEYPPNSLIILHDHEYVESYSTGCRKRVGIRADREQAIMSRTCACADLKEAIEF